jgi:hypothetical protein
MWLTNGTKDTLRGLRVQNCVMFKGAPEFAEQSNDNKLFAQPYAACRSKAADRWVITAWDPCQRVWGNPPCPCMHSDPQFPDCPPGKTVRLRGWLSFFEGKDAAAEFRRIEEMGWRGEAKPKFRTKEAPANGEWHRCCAGVGVAERQEGLSCAFPACSRSQDFDDAGRALMLLRNPDASSASGLPAMTPAPKGRRNDRSSRSAADSSCAPPGLPTYIVTLPGIEIPGFTPMLLRD